MKLIYIIIILNYAQAINAQDKIYPDYNSKTRLLSIIDNGVVNPMWTNGINKILQYRIGNDTLDVVVRNSINYELLRATKKEGKWTLETLTSPCICSNVGIGEVYVRENYENQPIDESFEFTFENCIKYETSSNTIVEISIEKILERKSGQGNCKWFFTEYIPNKK